jgi:hypothetical protein
MFFHRGFSTGWKPVLGERFAQKKTPGKLMSQGGRGLGFSGSDWTIIAAVVGGEFFGRKLR